MEDPPSMRFSHQDSPLTDEQERHRCRSAPDAAERRITPGGSLPRGAALEVRDASLQTWPAASTAPFNWVRNPGEKTSMTLSDADLRSWEPVAQQIIRDLSGCLCQTKHRTFSGHG